MRGFERRFKLGVMVATDMEDIVGELARAGDELPRDAMRRALGIAQKGEGDIRAFFCERLTVARRCRNPRR